MIKKLSLLIILLVGMNVVCAANETEICVPIYNFILDNYNHTSKSIDEFTDNYLEEFENLKNETNLTTSELKDYIVNYKDKCYLILPYENYTVKQENNQEKETKQKVTDFISSMFDDPKSFLMVISFIVLGILSIKLIKDSK